MPIHSRFAPCIYFVYMQLYTWAGLLEKTGLTSAKAKD